MPDRSTPRHHEIEWFFTTTEASGGRTTIVLAPREAIDTPPATGSPTIEAASGCVSTGEQCQHSGKCKPTGTKPLAGVRV